MGKEKEVQIRIYKQDRDVLAFFAKSLNEKQSDVFRRVLALAKERGEEMENGKG